MSAFKFLSKDAYKDLKKVGGADLENYEKAVAEFKDKFNKATASGKITFEFPIERINSGFARGSEEMVAFVIDTDDIVSKLEWLKPYIPKVITLFTKMADNLAKAYNFESFFELSLLLNAADKGNLQFDLIFVDPTMEYATNKFYECPHVRTENIELLLSEFAQEELRIITMKALQSSMTKRVLNRGKKVTPKTDETGDEDNIDSPL